MAGKGTTKHETRSPKRIPVVSAVLSAIFTYFAFLVVSVPILDNVFGMEIFHYQNIRIELAIVLFTGVGLWGIARRYKTPSVQTGALIGTGIMLVMGFVTVWNLWRAGDVVAMIVTFPVGLGIILTVNRLTKNPSERSGERSGIVVLWRSILGVIRRPDENETSRSESIPEPTTESDDSTTGNLFGSLGFPSVSRYWLIVGGAFAVCVPIAVVETELGLGLLSAFLSAYGLSHQIDRESSDIDEDDQDA